MFRCVWAGDADPGGGEGDHCAIDAERLTVHYGGLCVPLCLRASLPTGRVLRLVASARPTSTALRGLLLPRSLLAARDGGAVPPASCRYAPSRGHLSPPRTHGVDRVLSSPLLWSLVDPSPSGASYLHEHPDGSYDHEIISPIHSLHFTISNLMKTNAHYSDKSQSSIGKP